jgi:heme/copper-type cytochrome/quinol oxidase subunit 3
MAVMLIVGMEVMFFTGLISAFLIVKAGIKPGLWPPPWQPRLPIEVTAVNSVVLLLSGALLFVAASRFKKVGVQVAKRWMLASIVFGSTFVVVQGVEWVRLLKDGLLMTSSNHGAFFYLIVGCHGLHCVCGLLALTWVYGRLASGRLNNGQLTAMQIFWTFVVGLWPILYTLVYL